MGSFQQSSKKKTESSSFRVYCDFGWMLSTLWGITNTSAGSTDLETQQYLLDLSLCNGEIFVHEYTAQWPIF